MSVRQLFHNLKISFKIKFRYYYFNSGYFFIDYHNHQLLIIIIFSHKFHKILSKQKNQSGCSLLRRNTFRYKGIQHKNPIKYTIDYSTNHPSMQSLETNSKPSPPIITTIPPRRPHVGGDFRLRCHSQG